MENQNTITIEIAKYKKLLGRTLGIKTNDVEGKSLHTVVATKLKNAGSNISMYGDQQEEFENNLFDVELLLEFVRLHQ